ncbi:hypothetical protein E2H98_07505 [Permianibacter aggregans]|uniref:AraC effector-binding domain-containing protein n=1 Tax=Permianibacter aggregans TaxID=1510150 RepID=A0A4R6UR32_9GAMM|nr:hypothetical protein E2H98_07505 [Permianibacter aggregans]TDQ49748.1 hypothetical protein EV696_103117 [Permianibacter aggregans]
MKVMVIVKASKGSEAGKMPSEALLAAMGAYNQQLVDAGIMLAGEGLHPSSKGVRVRFSGDKRTVTDGPFAETKELIAGFWMWRVKSMDEAIEWVKRCPNPMMEDSDIEIRPVFEAEDFGAEFTPELREQEASIRAQAIGLSLQQFTDAPALHIAGLQQHYQLDTRGNIPLQWQAFLETHSRLPKAKNALMYGVVLNVADGCEFDYLTGMETDANASLPSGVVATDLPASRYAVFRHNEHVSTIDRTLEKIWLQWAPDAGVKMAETPCFERYTEQFNAETGKGGIEIWIPIER